MGAPVGVAAEVIGDGWVTEGLSVATVTTPSAVTTAPMAAPAKPIFAVDLWFFPCASSRAVSRATARSASALIFAVSIAL